ncbi:SRPBCC family protein [Formosa sediminum]|uniref:SRPBCC family protein n=1 Tax=Formosa sediminum TaxID=2594004 RepID=A0A516GT48_9FLAO|nr:SRPBCC family protein [Formosa sediminum]QDO94693.1 SRPBCC family protein [Formosa sediminum]
MGVYQFKRQQSFKQPIETLWDFISNPKNLKTITPDYMGFDIVTEDLPNLMYEGMIIHYKVSPVLGIKTTWVTEITHVKDTHYFVDEQRVGPYKIWHHQHFLEATREGTLMKDIVTYQPPFSILGDIANSIMIEKKLIEIFEYRTTVLNQLFGN